MYDSTSIYAIGTNSNYPYFDVFVNLNGIEILRSSSVTFRNGKGKRLFP